MSIEAIARMAAAGASAPLPPEAVTFQPSPTTADVTGFQGALNAAGAPAVGAVDALEPAVKAMFTQLEKVNGEAKSVAEYANAAQASGAEMTPGEVVNLTMRCHEFMFHCQLTSNIANRTSDGIQQLFRQQS
ncbi:hypothetical protein [Sphingomonas lenta]|uniref:hypothetical protein n=1 Tax=Sphingomonas lenta TaxID=1141887 RepID=UPI0015960402|nr:hypothetical protein [Sphingomonas lenta]